MGGEEEASDVQRKKNISAVVTAAQVLVLIPAGTVSCLKVKTVNSNQVVQNTWVTW